MSLYYLSVTLHVLAAMFWLGGMFFLALVGAPVLRKVDPPELRAHLFQTLGESFRSSGWIAVGILLATGVANLHFNGVLSPAVLGQPEFWSTSYGRALAWKLFGVGGMVLTSALHDFVLGPRAGRMRPGTPEALSVRRRAALLARFNAFLGIVVVLAAVRLAR